MNNFNAMTNQQLNAFFGDFHKDVWGVRPHSNYSRDEIIQFCEYWTSTSAQDILRDQWQREADELNDVYLIWGASEDEDQPDQYELLAERWGY